MAQVSNRLDAIPFTESKESALTKKSRNKEVNY